MHYIYKWLPRWMRPYKPPPKPCFYFIIWKYLNEICLYTVALMVLYTMYIVFRDFNKIRKRHNALRRYKRFINRVQRIYEVDSDTSIDSNNIAFVENLM